MVHEVLGEYFFSQVIGKKIYDSEGQVIGKIRDMTVKWNDASPIVTCIQFAKGQNNHIDISEVNQWSEKGLILKRKQSELVTRPLNNTEIYVRKWLLDKQIIDLNGSKLVRVNDITLSWITHGDTKEFILVGVDIGIRGLLRRLGIEFLVKKYPHNFLGWQHIKPLESKLGNLHLRNEFSQLSDLHPADIADIIEELGHSEREKILSALDDEKMVDVLSEVEFDTQVKIIDGLDYQGASDILREMSADEAADILGELSTEKSDQILKLMKPEDAEDVRELMNYPEKTAGSLMTTEFVAFTDKLTAEETIQQLRQKAADAETIYYIYVTDAGEVLQGVLSLRELIIAQPCSILQDIMHKRVIAIGPLEEQQKALETVVKYGLLALPVINAKRQLLGIITVDDLLETVMPDRSDLSTFSTFMLASSKGWGK